MLLTTILLHLLCLTPITAHSTTSQPFSPDTIPASTRAHWIQRANSALSELYSPCPFMAFATAIVNHSDTSTSPHGSLICLGVNDVLLSGNPTLHGEVAAINNCSEILKAREGWKGEDVSKAWRELSLYTNGEPCPMCTTAIRWAGFKETIYSVSAPRLKALGWPQIDLRTKEIFEISNGVLGTQTVLIEHVLEEESQGWFDWQYTDKACPEGCARGGGEKLCLPVEGERIVKEEL